jgi:Glycosyl transferases group 1/Glycosyltransferase Family 4
VAGRRLRILLYLDNLRVGGAQHATIDLAVGLREAGHEVTLAAGPGPLEAVVADRDVRRIAVPAGPHPSRAGARAVTRAVDEADPEVVVALGPWAAMEALAGAGRARRVPVVAGYPSATLPPDAPRSTPVFARRPAVLAAARKRNPFVADIPAAVDTTYNHPGVDGTAFRQAHGADGAALIVLVTRLTAEQKAEGLDLAIRAAATLAARHPARLVIVGDGGHRPQVEARVEREGGGAVVVLDEVADPRPAYAAADVVLGLGTSVLRGMAMGRPAIVLGPEGQAVTVAEDVLADLVATGWLASGEPVTPERLADHIEVLLDHADRADTCARVGRRAVIAERDTARVVELLEPVLAHAVGEPPGRAAVAMDVVRSWSTWWVRLHAGRLGHRVGHRYRQLARREAR